MTTTVSTSPAGHWPSLKERQRAEREALILDEAERILSEQGYNELVMEHLAERVGIGKGTIYLHFPRKEDLVAAIVARGLERMTERVAAITRADGTAAERLGAIMDMLIDQSSYFQALEEPVRRALMETVANERQTGGRFGDLFCRLFDQVGAVIDQGKADGEFTPSIATPVAVLFLLFAGRASGWSHVAPVVAIDRAQLKESIMRLYFDGLHIRSEQKGTRS